MCTPYPNSTGSVGGCDPLTVRGVAGNGGRVSMLAIDVDFQRVVEVPNYNGPPVGVENGIGLRVAGD